MAVPKVSDLIVPTFIALRELGGSGRNAEIRSLVAENLEISEEDQQMPQGQQNRNVSRLEYRLKWSRTYLKNAGIIRSIGFGLWELTSRGMKASETEILNSVMEWRRKQAQGRVDDEPQANIRSTDTEAEDEDDSGAEVPWNEMVIAAVQKMDPSRVEWLFLRILREEGFEQLDHVGKPGDGGIDGVGVYRISLLSFRIFFQCKRYQSGIGSSDIRNFRGAMEGRGERGLFVTTSWFTKTAEEEASRPGARPIDLIDGSALAELLAKHGLGVSIEKRDTRIVDRLFFEDFNS